MPVKTMVLQLPVVCPNIYRIFVIEQFADTPKCARGALVNRR